MVRQVRQVRRVSQLKADYMDNVTVRFDVGDKHDMNPRSVQVEKLFQCPDLDGDAFEIVHDQLHIFENSSGKFFTLHASVVEVQDVEWGGNRRPWNVFTDREKRYRESSGLARPISFEFII